MISIISSTTVFMLTYAHMAQPASSGASTDLPPLDTPPPQVPSKQKQLSDFEKRKVVFAYKQTNELQTI